MRREDCSTGKKRYGHLSEGERNKIEVLLEAKTKPVEVARILGRHVSTIYREIERGSVTRVQWDLSDKRQYRVNVAQRVYEERGRNKERGLKIGQDKALEEHIRQELAGKKFSPDVIIGRIKAKGLKFKRMICVKTLYNYIDRGLFSGIDNEVLWEKGKRKKRRYGSVVRPSRKNRMCRSIEERPGAVNDRLEYGHWEGDTVKGPKGSTASMLTLTERTSREEVIVKLAGATQENVQEAMDDLEKRLGDGFRTKFRSITFDNGVEFLDWRSLEMSVLGSGGQRTTIYFAHAYSAWERGTNENLNRMIRRFFPKGTNIALLDEEEIARVMEWMNNYPRRILGYRTPYEVASELSEQGNSGQGFKSFAL